VTSDLRPEEKRLFGRDPPAGLAVNAASSSPAGHSEKRTLFLQHARARFGLALADIQIIRRSLEENKGSLAKAGTR